MGKEYEYKFVLKNMPDINKELGEINISQGYFNKNSRVRICSPIIKGDAKELKCYYEHFNEYFSYGESAFITIKDKFHNEFEYQIPYNDGIKMIDTVFNNKNIIKKNRHIFKIDNIIWEVDEYCSYGLEGLYIAEAEFSTEEEFLKNKEIVYKTVEKLSNEYTDVTGNYIFSNNYFSTLNVDERITLLRQL